MRYEFETTDDVSGTYLQGKIRASYDELLAALGEASPGDGYKTQAEWAFKIFDTVEDRYIYATVYDWKQDVPPEEVTEWNVGGYCLDAVEAIETILAETKGQAVTVWREELRL